MFENVENRAVGTNGDIHRRKHASQGKKVKKKPFIFYFFIIIIIIFFFLQIIQNI